MKKSVKICLAIGLSVALVGLVVFLAGLGANGWIYNTEFEMHTFTAENEATALELDVSAGKFTTEYYDGETIQVEYPTSARFSYTVKERDGKITVRRARTTLFSFGLFRVPEVTVKIPKGSVLDLSVDISAGIINLAAGSFKTVDVDVSAGKFNAEAMSCSRLTCDVSAGTVKFASVECTSTDIDVSAGTVKIDNLLCPAIDIDVSAGDVILTVEGKRSDYTVSVDRSAGSCNVSSGGGDKAGWRIAVDISAGDVEINFTD